MGTGSHFGAVGGVSLQWRGSASLYAKLGFHMVDVHSYVYMHTYTHVHTMSRMWIRDQDHCRKHVMAEHEPRWGMFRAWLQEVVPLLHFLGESRASRWGQTMIPAPTPHPAYAM
mgnify:CR=1 FL=1